MDENTTLADLVALNLHNFEDEVRTSSSLFMTFVCVLLFIS